jgi:uracil-DNA glycosylase
MLNKIHDSWKPFFTEEKLMEIREIEEKIKDNYNPSSENVFRFAANDINNVKCVWLGQDPYPAEPIYDQEKKEYVYVATGRAFEVGILDSWTGKFNQHSLKNIIRLIYKAYNSELLPFGTIRGKIRTGEFNILPPRQWFDSLEKQGVLFLNTYLTCQTGVAGSHREMWKDFSIDLLKFISESNPNINWFLWGKEAQENQEYMKGRIFKSNHPRLYNTSSKDDFLNCPCFDGTKNLIDWRGYR